MELVELLIENGANMESKNEDGDTALMLAVRSEHTAVVDTLCKRGCQVHTDSIEYAKNKRNLYLSDVLLKHHTASNTSLSSPLASDSLNQNNNNNKIDEEVEEETSSSQEAAQQQQDSTTN